MAWPAYPTSPAPRTIQEEVTDWPAVSFGGDAIGQVRAQTAMPIRTVKLGYEGLSSALLESLLTFLTVTCRGRGQPVAFMHPRDGSVTFNARLVEIQYPVTTKQAFGPRHQLSVTLKEIP